jgi:hypothetical protein
MLDIYNARQNATLPTSVTLMYLHFVLNNTELCKYMPTSSNEFTVISYRNTSYETDWGIFSFVTVGTSITGKEFYIWWRVTAGCVVCRNIDIFSHHSISQNSQLNLMLLDL